MTTRRARAADASKTPAPQLLAAGQPVTFDDVAARAGTRPSHPLPQPRPTRHRRGTPRPRTRSPHPHRTRPPRSPTCAPPSKPSPPTSAATKNNSADYAVTTNAPTAEFLRHPTPPKRPRISRITAGELLRRTLRVDRPHRGHRPDADLRRATPAQRACPVRRALQPAAAASSAAAASAAPDNHLSPSRSTAGSGVDRSSAA